MNMKGFASMSPEKRKEIARKGGLTISQNKQHMSDIGRKGGEASGKIRVEKADQKSLRGHIGTELTPIARVIVIEKDEQCG
jgi:general stress protein YciG